MKIFCKFPIVNISKLNFLLLICFAKELIWTIKGDFLNIKFFFLHPQIADFQIVVLVKYCPVFTKPYINGNLIYCAFR